MELSDMSIECDLTRVCRSCCRDGQSLQPIFNSTEIDGVTLHDMITSCTQIKIYHNDGMPQNVCTECTADIHSAYNFHKRYVQSDSMLREYLSRRKVDTIDGVKMELFEVKPDITFIDADPLIGEKCFVRTVEVPQSEGDIVVVQQQQLRNEPVVVGDDAVLDEGEMVVEFVDDSGSDAQDGPAESDEDDDDDDDNDADYDEVMMADLIEELEETMPRQRRTRANKNAGYTKIRTGQFACDYCDKIFPDQRKMANHMKQHKPKALKECPVCAREFVTNYHLSRHMKIHGYHAKCKQCDKNFSTYQEYEEHMTVVHPGVELEPPPVKITKPEHDLALTLTAELIEEKGKTEAICRICDCTFDRIVELRNHLKTHVDPKSFADVNIQTKPYLFEEGYVLENYLDYLVQQVCKGDLLRFYQIVDGDGDELELSDSDSETDEADLKIEGVVRRQHNCATCNQSFPRIKSILEHAKEHNPEDLLGCSHCARGFPNTALLVRHIKQQCGNSQKKFICTFCNEKFMWQTSLNKHAQIKHKPTKPLWEKPEPVADLPEASGADGRDRKFVCQICNKGFQRSEHLDRHIKIHIPSEKKFECTQCHKKFNRKDNLRSHMKIHKRDPEEVALNKQNQLCIYCGRGFSNSSNLIVHMRRHTGERPYKCDICDKGFPRSSDLQCHRRTHTGEKPCLCTICGKGFSRSNKLVRHMRIHTGARPYSCTYCDRSFTQSNDLTLHIRRHTGEKPYVCGVCNERFIQGTALKAHQRITGHFDDGSNQPERFASISVNNPNRLGINGPKAVRQSGTSESGGGAAAPRAVKQIKSRKKAAASGKSVPPATNTVDVVQPPASPPPVSASPDESSSGSRPTLVSLPAAPHGYVSVPYLMQNYDLTTGGIFSQNFTQQ